MRALVVIYMFACYTLLGQSDNVVLQVKTNTAGSQYVEMPTELYLSWMDARPQEMPQDMWVSLLTQLFKTLGPQMADWMDTTQPQNINKVMRAAGKELNLKAKALKWYNKEKITESDYDLFIQKLNGVKYQPQ